MKRLSIILLLVFCVSYFGFGKVPAAQAAARTISVQGESEFTVSPDEASIEIGVETTGKTAQDASQANAAAMDNIKKALSLVGVTAEDIKTSSYNFYPTYDNNNRQHISYYKAENTITVTTNDITKVSKIIDTAAKYGASNVNSVTFGIKDSKKYQDKALQLAAADAKAKANTIAAAFGRNLVNIVSVDGNNVRIENYMPQTIMMKAVSADVSTPINAKNLNVSAKISVTFEIN